MKRLIIFTGFIMFWAAFGFAQPGKFSGNEPDRSELDAPLYPGAVFIRTVSGLDPYYETALYVTPDSVRAVEVFFERKMPEKLKAYYEDENRYMTVFLLKTWSTFSGRTSKEELSKLEHEPNIQIIEYDRSQYETLAELYERNPYEKYKADDIRTGRTLIRYTYRRTEKNRSARKIVGTWISVDRDLSVFYKSVITFNGDGIYSYLLTPENVTALSDELTVDRRFTGKPKEEILNYIRSRNPEQGNYVIMRNTITLFSEKPVIEPKTKNGIARVGKTLLSLDFVNRPRLSFIRDSSE